MEVTEEPAPEATAEPEVEADAEPAAASNLTVTYYDPSTKSERQANRVTPVTSSVQAWKSGWYTVGVLVDGVLKMSSVRLDQVTVTSKVNLILPKGSSLTVTGGIQIEESGSLTMWGDNDYLMAKRRRALRRAALRLSKTAGLFCQIHCNDHRANEPWIICRQT